MGILGIARVANSLCNYGGFILPETLVSLLEGVGVLSRLSLLKITKKFSSVSRNSGLIIPTGIIMRFTVELVPFGFV